MSLREHIARLWNLRTAFRGTFLDPAGNPHPNGAAVLGELRRFCYGAKPTIKLGLDGKVDPYASIAAAARQEVYQRVLAMLNLDDTDIRDMERRAHQQEEVTNE